MKRIILMLISVIRILQAPAQQPANPVFPKTIQVTGIAEIVIVPDEIHVLVTLKEYERKGRAKMEIEAIRNSFLTSARKAGITDSAIKILSLDGNSGVQWWRRKQQKDELYASVVYEIIFSNAEKIEALVNVLDDDATQNFAIAQITHSNLVTLQMKLRIDALKTAKTKAGYLAEAISEKIGSAITITENSFSQIADNNKMYSNVLTEARQAGNEFGVPEFKKMTIRSEMNVVFELK